MIFLKTCALTKQLKIQYSCPFFQFLCVYVQYVSSMGWFEMLWWGLVYIKITWGKIILIILKPYRPPSYKYGYCIKIRWILLWGPETRTEIGTNLWGINFV